MLRWISLLAIILALALTGLYLAINAGLLTKRIEQELQKVTGSPVKLGPVKLRPRWPLTFVLGPTDIDHTMARVQFQELTAQIASFAPPYEIRLDFVHPKVVVKPMGPVVKGPGQPAQGGGTRSTSSPIKLDLNVESGEIVYGQYSISSLQLAFSQRQLLKTPARVRFKAFVVTPFLPGSIPVTLESDSLTLTEESVKSESTRTWVGGMSAVLQGGSLLVDQRHRWSISINAPDLSKLPEPPLDIPAKNWKGSVQMKAEVTKENAQKPWAAEGTLNLKELGADLKWNKAGLGIEGPFRSNAFVKFSYADEKVLVPEMTLGLDLTAARVQGLGFLDKPTGVLLKTDVVASGSMNQLKLQRFATELAKLKVAIAGETQLATPFPAKLQIHLSPTNLKGIESLIPPLKTSPVQGSIEAKVQIDGPLIEPAKANLKVSDLKLRNFSAQVEYTENPSLQVRGPVSANVDVAGEWAGGLKSAQGSGQINLGSAALVLGPLRKEARQPLAAAFAIKNQGEVLQIDRFEANGFFGVLRARGKVSELAQPVVDLKVETAPLNLSELRMAMPSLRDLIPKGSIEGNLGLKGKMALNLAWPQWPLVVTGNLAVAIPEYKILPTPPPPPSAIDATASGPAPVPAPAAGFLPEGSLTRQARVQAKVNIELLLLENLTVKGVAVQGLVADGKFAGDASIRQIFGGSVTTKALEVPLISANPILSGTANWNQLTIQEALEFVKPEYKSIASGKMKGQAHFATVLPSAKEFLNALSINGDANLEPVTLNSVRVGQMINDLLAKIPGLKVSPAKLDPLKGVIRSTFDLKQGVIQLPNLQAKDVDNSELQMKGNVVLSTMSGDLVGNFHWAQPTVKGCLLEGNLDTQGRMVIPLSIKGHLMQPGVSVLSDVVGKLASRALECEKKKLVDKVKAEGTQQLKKEVNKVLEGLLGN